MTLGKNKVLIERFPAPEKTTEAGFKIPDVMRERPDFGTVIEVGSEVTTWKPGQKVLYPKWSGFQITIPGDERDLLVLFEDEVWLAL
jgi:chaperonin GroES